MTRYLSGIHLSVLLRMHASAMDGSEFIIIAPEFVDTKKLRAASHLTQIGEGSSRGTSVRDFDFRTSGVRGTDVRDSKFRGINLETILGLSFDQTENYFSVFRKTKKSGNFLVFRKTGNNNNNFRKILFGFRLNRNSGPVSRSSVFQA